MTRCTSRYQNRNTKGEPLGKPYRCTAKQGHVITDEWHSQHRNLRPGRRVFWPTSAEIKD